MATELEVAAQRFLDQLNNDPAFERLVELVELLENKVDPDPTEVRLCENIYNVVEKIKIMENNIRSYVSEARQNLPGNKLSALYEENSYDGSGSIIKD
jgi:intein-encoded DNA endonuclease-like protein